MSSKRAKTALDALTFDGERYVALLAKLVGEAERLQNSPPQGLYPREDNASNHVLAALKPHTVEAGGPLVVERVAFTEGRGNVIIKYPGATADSVALSLCRFLFSCGRPSVGGSPGFVCSSLLLITKVLPLSTTPLGLKPHLTLELPLGTALRPAPAPTPAG